MLTTSTADRGRARIAAAWVFATLLGSYAYFWQSRDWNSASRLMLTYAMVDRGTIAIDGLEAQTGDRASFRGHTYSDKPPGASTIGVPAYAMMKAAFRLPDHPLGQLGFAYWPADYGTTLAISAIPTAATGALLVILAAGFGCGPRRSALVGLAFGLATPAYAYATLAYGHAASSACLLASFALIRGSSGSLLAGLAGFCAALAATCELAVGPVSAILGSYLAARVLAGRSRASTIPAFAIGAAGPTIGLLLYNLLAFGSPWDMGYFHHATPRFAQVHSADNPLGLRKPDGRLVARLIWGGYRGMLFYAPILILAPPGWFAMLARRRTIGVGVVAIAAASATFVVNLSYPEWTGGWSTGPRLLLPAIPFGMIGVAGLLSIGGRPATSLAILLAMGGGVLILMFVAVGGRIPETVADPFSEIVLPLWSGGPIPRGWIGGRFARDLASIGAPEIVSGLGPKWAWAQFLPLLGFQALMIAGMLTSLRPPRSSEASVG